ncbi:protein TolR [Terasakiella sp. SH-1]|uniref:protein TolR n=1 Tax=Terasakiella sp. SH-1 TaxID=2560057 RepID=UPI0010747406|nr:protein TolR [Terasakiella sp. SH-1]
MGASLNQRRNKGHYGRRRNSTQMSEINVTPMVDVMLVLLVIFMVTAPLLTVGVEVDLPKTKAGEIRGQDEPLAVSIDKEGNLFVQDTQVELDGLAPLLLEISKNNQDVRIFVRGDEAIDYGTVMQVMGVLNKAGFGKVALITRNPDQGRKK